MEVIMNCEEVVAREGQRLAALVAMRNMDSRSLALAVEVAATKIGCFDGTVSQKELLRKMTVAVIGYRQSRISGEDAKMKAFYAEFNDACEKLDASGVSVEFRQSLSKAVTERLAE